MISFELMDNVENGEEGNGHEMKVPPFRILCITFTYIHVYVYEFCIHCYNILTTCVCTLNPYIILHA